MPTPEHLQRLHIEPIGGVAGDMLLAALLDLGADTSTIREAFLSLKLPPLQLVTERVLVNDTPALHVRSLAHAPRHAHRHLTDIITLLKRSELSSWARAFAGRVFATMAEAEAVVHGGPAETVHLHEVGRIDSIMDVVGIAVALETLGCPTMTYSALPSGHGFVMTEHGLLPCPVPAVVAIVRHAGLALVDVDIAAETITPTGAAVLAAAQARLSEKPDAEPTRIGVGAGSQRFVQVPNVVRIYGWSGSTS